MISFQVSSDMESGFEEFCCRLSESAHENVQSRQRGIESSVTEALDTFEQIFQILESELANKLPNAKSKA